MEIDPLWDDRASDDFILSRGLLLLGLEVFKIQVRNKYNCLYKIPDR